MKKVFYYNILFFYCELSVNKLFHFQVETIIEKFMNVKTNLRMKNNFTMCT